jgi:sulfate transport system ATP-binding protein
MNKGRVEQTGPTQDVYEHPATAFAYSFLGAVNRLPGRVDGGSLRVGDATVPLAECTGLCGGEEVIAFARPHELDIVVDGSDGQGVPASVRRVLVSGAVARVELTGGSAGGETAELPRFEVEISRERLGQLNLRPGQAVRLTSSRLRVFPVDRQS